MRRRGTFTASAVRGRDHIWLARGVARRLAIPPALGLLAALLVAAVSFGATRAGEHGPTGRQILARARAEAVHLGSLHLRGTVFLDPRPGWFGKGAAYWETRITGDIFTSRPVRYRLLETGTTVLGSERGSETQWFVESGRRFAWRVRLKAMRRWQCRRLAGALLPPPGAPSSGPIVVPGLASKSSRVRLDGTSMVGKATAWRVRLSYVPTTWPGTLGRRQASATLLISEKSYQVLRYTARQLVFIGYGRAPGWADASYAFSRYGEPPRVVMPAGCHPRTRT